MAKQKFTFKTVRPTGSYASFFPNNNYIKLKKKKVGSIDDRSPHLIRLMVIKNDINEDDNPNCSWKWITLSKKFSDIDSAKVWLNENIDAILEKFNLYKLEE